MSTPAHRTLVVLHDLGDPAGGAPWAAAFADVGWPGIVVAPDLPGHAGTAPPVGGNYELADPAFTFASLGLDVPVDLVVGLGASGWAAQLVALGGQARALALVDGVGGPWNDRHERLRQTRRRLRALAGFEPTECPDGLDPPLAHPPLPHGNQALASRALASMPVPVLIVETPTSPLDVGQLDAAVGAPGATCVVERASSDEARVIAEMIVAWAAR